MDNPFIALLQIVKAFETNNIEYVVVGSVASSIHQWRDIKGILGTQESILDRDYLHSWAERIGVLDLLARAEEELQQ